MSTARPGMDFMSRLVASRPEIPGIEISMSTTSGFDICTLSRVSRPSEASPTTSISIFPVVVRQHLVERWVDRRPETLRSCSYSPPLFTVGRRAHRRSQPLIFLELSTPSSTQAAMNLHQHTGQEKGLEPIKRRDTGAVRHYRTVSLHMVKVGSCHGRPTCACYRVVGWIVGGPIWTEQRPASGKV